MLRIPIPCSPSTLAMDRVEEILIQIIHYHSLQDKVTTREITHFIQHNIYRLSLALRLVSDQMMIIALYYLDRYLNVDSTTDTGHRNPYYKVYSIKELSVLFCGCCILAAKMYHDYDLRCKCEL
jgi:hypothetical protein